jgi:hypothetical protein
MGIGGSGIHDAADKKMTAADWAKMIPLMPLIFVYTVIMWLIGPKDK